MLQTTSTITEDEFKTHLMKYYGIEPGLKLRLSKLFIKPSSKSILEELSNIINNGISNETNLQKVHSLTVSPESFTNYCCLKKRKFKSNSYDFVVS